MTAVPADNVELQMVVANALYRVGQTQAKDRPTTLQALDVGAEAFLTVLKNARRNDDAAHNYEYVVKMREELTRNRRKPGLPVAEPGTPLGRPGAVAKNKTGDAFKVYVPLESEEREEADAAAKKLQGPKNPDPSGGNAGKAPPKGRKG
jgi:hypothetical protein